MKWMVIHLACLQADRGVTGVGVGDGEHDIWGEVWGLDNDQCALKVVCELARLSDAHLTRDGQAIKNIFR